MSGVVCLIPARGGSKRIPRKNLVDLCGKPLIAWTIECALKADVGPVWVSTDDDEIADVSREWGAEVHRRAAVAQDDETALDVLDDFELPDENRLLVPMVYLQPTSPLRQPSTVQRAAVWARDGDATIAAKRGLRLDANSRYDWIRDPALLDCGCVYGLTPRPRWHSFQRVINVEPWEAIDIDWPWDLAAAECAMKERGMV